ncbi:MAG TPA: hypothetical protein VLA76_03415 [Candidatus Angelobacter sp.]|nr:hypothetical protein [Candidatus Angelobacter sp.]
MSAVITATAGAQHRAAVLVRLRRLARGATSALAAIRARWEDFVDAGQLGPSAVVLTSRHTGSRI